MERARLGRGALEVSRTGLGCAPLGNLFAEMTDDDATATIDAAWNRGVRYFDTAPLYGHGLSERRVGAALRSRPRDEYVLSTKVGRLLRDDATVDPGIFRVERGAAPVFDFARDAVLRSIDESLERLGLDRIDIALVHDPDDHEDEAMREAFPALLELRDQGVVHAVGAGMNQSAMLSRFAERVDIDCVLLAGRYTLLDQSGAPLLDECAARGVKVILGGVFNSGVLAMPSDAATFDYAPAPTAVRARAQAMRDACDRYGVALPAAALAFAHRHPAVSTVLVGARSPAEVDADINWADALIPDELWSELAAL